MILIDSRVGSRELLPYIQRVGVKSQMSELQFGDACFEGNGPDGRMAIGIERKTIGDMLNCIDDSRYSAYQRPGMLAMYQKSLLVIEGVWKPDVATGYLMECVAQLTWRPYRPHGRMVMYHKLFRYLLTIQFSGVSVIWSRDMEQTAYNICEVYHWFQKPWDQHTSLMELQKLNIPSMNGRPSLVQRWAADLDGVGIKHSSQAAKIFKTPYDLARSDETSWLTIPGVGVKLARSIIRQIHGEEQ